MAWKMIVFLSLVLQLLNSVDGTAKTYDILILGAGASGIGAALECRDRGIENFLVLEAKDYIGGRMKTGKIGNNITVELGAGWVHHANLDHRMYKLIKKHKLDLYKEDYNSVVYREDNGNHINASATMGEMDAMMDAVDSLAERRAEEGKGTPSLRTALRMVGWRPDTPIKRAVEFWVFDFENGCTPNKIDSIAYGYTASGDDFVVTDQDGFSSALREEIKPIREKFKLEVEVTKISKGEGRYVVTTSKGTFLAKHVVVTFSSGVLLANHVEFSPPLPAWKREPLGMVPMVSYCKYFLMFSETFWSTDFHFTMLVDRKRGYFQHLQDMTMKAPHLLLVTVTDELCREQALVPDDEIIDQVHKSIKESYRNAPRPLELTRYSWDQDRFFGGAYSTQNGGVTEDDYSALEHPIVDDNPKDSSLWFTGEYTGRWNFGYTHSALDLGQATASKMIDCIKGKSCPEKLPQKTTNAKKGEEENENDKDSSSVPLTVRRSLLLFLLTFSFMNNVYV